MKDKKNKCKEKSILKRILIIATIVILCCLLSICIFYYCNLENIKNEERITLLGFNEVYNNNKARFYEPVTKIEVLKMVFVATYNRLDIDNLPLNLSDCNSEEEKWLKYCKAFRILLDDTVTLENCNQKVTLIELLTLINNARMNVLEDKNAIDADLNYSDLDIYSEKDKSTIAELVTIGILENNNKNINAYNEIHKKEVNNIIMKYILKYNTVTLDGYTVTIDEEKMPSNANDYPYIVEEVDKEVYEQNPIIQNNEMYYTPADFYEYQRKYYDHIVTTAEDYYNAILNVNYNDIAYDSFCEKIRSNAHGVLKTDAIERYIKYVKDNKIVITGKATAQLPIIYNDGVSCRIRMKLEFEVKESNVNENLLCFDDILGMKICYEKNKYTLYIDQEMGYVIDSYHVFAIQLPVYTFLLDMSKDQLIWKNTYEINY